MQPVRIAIVGCGQATDELHLPAALASRELEVASLVDTDGDRARYVARKYGLKCSLSRELSSDVVDGAEGVVIVTPNHTHALLAKRALEGGRPVLVEKPMTVTYAEATDLCEIARRHGSFISVGFVTRHYPVVPLFKRLLSEGFFGRVARFHFEYGGRGGWAPASGYTLDRSQSGGGVLVTNGTHFLDRMLYWFGQPDRFRYLDDSYGGVEANCKLSMEFAEGLTGSVFLSKTMVLRNAFTMTTDRYLVEIPYLETNEITLSLHASPGVKLSAHGPQRLSAQEAFRVQLEEFGRVIRSGGTPTVSGEAGAMSVKFCEECYERREQIDETWAWYKETASV